MADYESDPEDSPLPSLRRREVASDDEEEGSDGKRKMYEEVNGEGGAEVYGEEDGEEYDDAEDELDEYDELGEELLEEEELSRQTEKREEKNEEEQKGEEGSVDPTKEGEKKKENEPFAVPTSGAFYMHDDRFQESNGRGGGATRGRRVQGGGRKIWNAKEEGAWVHDRFEQMNFNDNGRRGGRGGFRGGRGRGAPQRGRGGFRPVYNNNNNNNNNMINNNNGNYVASRSVRGNGRGSRRYEPVNRNNIRNNYPQDKQPARNHESISTSINPNPKPHQSSSSSSSLNPNTKPSLQLIPKKPTNNNNPTTTILSSSSLNSASPPFYPSSDSRPTSSSLNPNPNNTNTSRGLGVNSPTKVQYVVKQVQPNSGEDKGKQQSGLMYGGVTPGDQGFAGTPALLPVMQFSGQHPGVPALGMAVPGYVANSQSGFGNPAWVIAGSGYPYVTGYYNNNENNNITRPASQASSSAPSSNSAKSPDPIKSSQKIDISNEELGQRQNKPRRYSEMNFGQ